MTELIKIELTEEEALLFKRLREQKIFEIANGSVEIHFDKDKRIVNMVIHRHFRY